MQPRVESGSYAERASLHHKHAFAMEKMREHERTRELLIRLVAIQAELPSLDHSA